MNSEEIHSALYSSTQVNENFLFWFLNLVTRNFSMSRGGRLLLGVNPKGCEVAEYIATKIELNPWMLSTFKTQNPYEA